MSNLEGRELGGCRLIRKLGAGGMGEVYLAEQQRLGNRLVAVKIVSPDDATFQPEIAEDIARRFQREAALLGQLSHPNILPVHDSGIEGSLLYLVMEYAPDGSLADAIRGTGKLKLPLPVALPRAIDILSQIAAALQYTHEHGVIHRDVKPGNVLIRVEPDGHWHILLADYGVARGMDTTSQRTQVSGTFAFMAPEQFSAQFSPASDQYALGVLAFLLLAGRTPFDGDLASLTRAHMFEPPPSLRALNPTLPPSLEAVVSRALAKEPDARYPSVAAFANALRAAAGVSGTSATADTSSLASAIDATTRVATGEMATQRAWMQGETAAIPPSTQRQRRKPQVGRAMATLLIAALLLAGVSAGVQLVHNQGSLGKTTATQVVPKITATATTSASATATVPACAESAALTIDADVTCVPAAPLAVGKSLLVDPSLICDKTTITPWTVENNTQKTCPADAQGGGAQVSPTDATTTTLACLAATSITAGNGYASVLVSRDSGGVALGFRNGSGETTGTSTVIAGYYVVLTSSKGSDQPLDQYELFQLDQQGTSHLIGMNGPAPLPQSTSLAKHFALGVTFTGATFHIYVNGQEVSPANPALTDATFTQGYVSACTLQGTSTFSNVQVFALGS